MGTTATEHEGKTDTEPGDPQGAGTRVHGLLSLCEPWQSHRLSQGAPWKALPDRGHVRLIPCPSLKDLDAAPIGRSLLLKHTRGRWTLVLSVLAFGPIHIRFSTRALPHRR